MEHFGEFVLNHWMLSSSFILLFILILINEWLVQKNRPRSLGTQQVIDLMNHGGAIVVDLRDTEAYRKGHIIDALHASADDFKQGKMEKHKTQPMILVCARGLQSPALATKLHEQGFIQPIVLTGGMEAWTAADLPLIKGNK